MESATDGVALATMCVSSSQGLTATTLERCLVSVACARERLSRPLPIVSFVDQLLPAAAAAFLRDRLNVTLHRVPLNVSWPSSSRYPNAPNRLYTFQKLRAWKLLEFRRVLWFDSDAFFTADPVLRFLERYSPFAAAYFPMHPAGARSFNTGLMLLQPSREDHARIVAKWRSGAFEAHLGLSDLSEQDLLIAVFGDEFHRMETCDNFRGRHRPYHKNCADTPTLHNSFFVGQALNSLSSAMRRAIARDVLATLTSRVNLQSSILSFFDLASMYIYVSACIDHDQPALAIPADRLRPPLAEAISI